MNKYNLNMLAVMDRINQLLGNLLPPSNVYEVWRTNIKIEHLELLYSVVSLDIAETKALKLLVESDYTVDYMVYCRTTQEAFSYAFSRATKAVLGSGK